MIILNIHDLDPNPSNPWAIHPNRLEQLINTLKEAGYSFPLPESLLDSASRRNQSGKEVLLTFDDCRLGTYQFGQEILDRQAIRALFFPVVSFMAGEEIPLLEAYSPFMNAQQICRLADAGHTIGSHGMRHVPYFHQTTEAIYADIAPSRIVLERLLGENSIRFFSAPYGQINSKINELALKSGFALTLSADEAINKPLLPLPYLRRFSLKASLNVETVLKQLEHACSCYQQINAVDCSEIEASRWDWSIIYRARAYDVVLCRSQHSVNLLRSFGVTYPLQVSGSDHRAQIEQFLSTAVSSSLSFPETRITISQL